VAYPQELQRIFAFFTLHQVISPQYSESIMTLQELYTTFNQLLASNKFEQAESSMQKILDIQGQPWQQYFYMPASFYESWGDYAIANGEEAQPYYQKALQYRQEIGYQATGSGEGMEAMYHIKRIRKKLTGQKQ
jgi:hypothetical protein